MPSSPALAHSGFGVTASILLLAVLASGTTLIASMLLVWRYRRKVDRLMSTRAGALATSDAAMRTMGHPSDGVGRDTADCFPSVGCTGDRAGWL